MNHELAIGRRHVLDTFGLPRQMARKGGGYPPEGEMRRESAEKCQNKRMRSVGAREDTLKAKEGRSEYGRV